MDSRAFHRIYYENVSSTGYESYKNSFQFFYELVLFPVQRDPVLIKKLEEVLRKAPFNAGFALYLYQMKNAVRGVYPHADSILKDITGNLKDYDVFHLSVNLTNQLL